MALLLRVNEVARRLGLPRNRTYEWIRQGLLPSLRDRRRLYVPERAVDELVERIARGEFIRKDA